MDGFRSAFAMRLYIIGDIHGRADLLDQIISKIHDDVDQYGATDCLTVTLGDYVDRGGNSRGVLDRLAVARNKPGAGSSRRGPFARFMRSVSQER